MASHHFVEMHFHGEQKVQQGYRVDQIHIFRFVVANRPFLSIRREMIITFLPGLVLGPSFLSFIHGLRGFCTAFSTARITLIVVFVISRVLEHGGDDIIGSFCYSPRALASHGTGEGAEGGAPRGKEGVPPG